MIWMKMGWMDIIFLVVFFAGIFIGLRKGVGQVFPGFVSVVTAQFVTVEYTQAFAEFMQARLQIPILILDIAIFTVLAAASIVSILFLFRIFSLIATMEFKHPIKNAAGALLSGFQFILFLGLLSSLLVKFPLPFIQDTFKRRSLIGPYLAESSEQVHDFFIPWFPKNWRATQ